MKLTEAAKKAIQEHDIKLFSGIVERLRIECEMNYAACAAFFQRITGIDTDEFENLCSEADELDSRYA